jgi:hypothetical protein
VTLPSIGPDHGNIEVVAAIIVIVEHCPPSMPDLLASVILRGWAGPVRLIFLHGKTAGIYGVLLPCGIGLGGQLRQRLQCRHVLAVCRVRFPHGEMYGKPENVKNIAKNALGRVAEWQTLRT